MDDHAAVVPRDLNAQRIGLEGASSNSNDDDSGEEDYVDMFGGNDTERGESEEEKVESSDGGGANTDESRPRKRQKREQCGDFEAGGDKNVKRDSSVSGKKKLIELTKKQQQQLDFAKNKLSKWAARLFDPNRPRGLVEPPKV